MIAVAQEIEDELFDQYSFVGELALNGAVRAVKGVLPVALEARRRGKKKALVAVGRSILVIIWHLLNDPETRFVDLGSDFYDTRLGTQRATLNHVRRLQALGYRVTLEPAA